MADFEKQAVLKPTKMFQVTVPHEAFVEVPHAQGEVSFGEVIHHICSDLVARNWTRVL
jgi:hypothetical protein